MEPIYDCLINKHGLAFGIGVVALLLTILLVSRHIIGFTLSLILILIGLGASYGVDHQDVVKSYWFKALTLLSPKQAGEAPAKEPTKEEAAPKAAPGAKTEESIQQSATPPSNLKGQTERQKGRVQRFIESHAPQDQPK